MSALLVGYTTSIDVFRARTATMRPTVLRKKTCRCGLAANAKQLAQYGRCVRCVRENKTWA
jgi:hypothetical protein